MGISTYHQFDTVVRNGTVITATEKMHCDIGIKDGVITALGTGLSSGANEVDVQGKYILPGGVEAHCHIEQSSSHGIMTADDFYSGSVSAAFGGNTTIVPFACQHKGQSLLSIADSYEQSGKEKSVIDFSYHVIVSDPTQEVLNDELPTLIRRGITSFKVYTTYELLKLDDYQMLEVLALARKEQALVMVHAENYDMIRWLTDRLLAKGHIEPKFHAISHPQIGEGEAANRVISLSEFIDVPLLIVHVSCSEATKAIREAQTKGLKIYGETCPQYLTLTMQDLEREGMEGAKFCCSPPPRDLESQESIWNGLSNGTFQILSSDHAPYRFDSSGKLNQGMKTPFNKIANGLPGIEVRLPLFYNEAVNSGRLDIHQFVALTSTNAARIYGLFPQKGTIAIGSDADLAIWDMEKEVEIRSEALHDNADYTPYEGKKVRGWPVQVMQRGKLIVEGQKLIADRGEGLFLSRKSSSFSKPLGRKIKEMDVSRNFGADLYT
ncbi:dihydropyrimidinase [Photobacterium minamisatsumaniensis]|uniref:dihydropyrimidinase n=1 Tax=Photobacterium minamisatsumaniensis TaxID=2910233 RepID=UPI003D0EA6D5